ncbi:fumarylacetoacetate hydrolase family protein [Pseudomonas typographi]|uniref:fumarylacetoacetate hydrolase family protein n=1 Tax=Pseudomonas typographi TaxID=2715964 RepID=UPI001683658D|nr:hydratase [Pseudomonas typographi]MBD1585094.1 hydratase [Pseudomonas typographi]
MSAVQQVASSLIRSWREGRQQALPDLNLASEAEAYQVQRQVADAIGWFDSAPPRAWKLGGAPGGLISAAAVPAGAVQLSGWQVPPGYCFGFGIEGEVIVRLSRDLDGHADLVEAYAAIDSWMPGIELCDTRWLSGDQAAPLLRLADQQLNRALILGAPRTFEQRLDWTQQRVELRVNGETKFSGSASHPFGDPLNSLPWLARHAAGQGNPLRAGDLVATGSWTGLYWAPAGARVEIEFFGMGRGVLVLT